MHNFTIKDCRQNIYILLKIDVYMIKKITNIKNNEKVTVTLSIGYMEFECQLYRLSKKNQKCKKQWFYF